MSPRPASAPQLRRVPVGPDLVRLSGTCPATGREHSTPPLPLAAVERYEAGEPVRLVFPHLSLAEREFLISGVSPESWRQVSRPPADELDLWGKRR